MNKNEEINRRYLIMPLHIYTCVNEQCDTEQEERLVKFSEVDDQKCKKCGEPLVLIPSYGNFSLKGKWYKTTRGY